MNCYYFGVNNQRSGHYLYAGDKLLSPSHVPKDFPVATRALDGGLLPPRLPQKQGQAELIHLRNWTILTFWDRSRDERYGSSSAFIIRGNVNFFAAKEIAQEKYPEIWERFDFEVTKRELPT